MNRKSDGNILDFVTVGVTVIAIAIVVLASFNSMGLMIKKLEISQIARKYILIMETQGCLPEPIKAQMVVELGEAGLKDIDISGTTLEPVEYGDDILLCISGCVLGRAAAGNDIWSEGFETKDYYVEEKRMSTAKN